MEAFGRVRETNGSKNRKSIKVKLNDPRFMSGSDSGTFIGEQRVSMTSESSPHSRMHPTSLALGNFPTFAPLRTKEKKAFFGDVDEARKGEGQKGSSTCIQDSFILMEDPVRVSERNQLGHPGFNQVNCFSDRLGASFQDELESPIHKARVAAREIVDAGIPAQKVSSQERDLSSLVARLRKLEARQSRYLPARLLSHPLLIELQGYVSSMEPVIDDLRASATQLAGLFEFYDMTREDRDGQCSQLRESHDEVEELELISEHIENWLGDHSMREKSLNRRIRCLSKLKQAESSLQETRAEAEKAKELRDSLISKISHFQKKLEDELDVRFFLRDSSQKLCQKALSIVPVADDEDSRRSLLKSVEALFEFSSENFFAEVRRRLPSSQESFEGLSLTFERGIKDRSSLIKMLISKDFARCQLISGLAEELSSRVREVSDGLIGLVSDFAEYKAELKELEGVESHLARLKDRADELSATMLKYRETMEQESVSNGVVDKALSDVRALLGTQKFGGSGPIGTGTLKLAELQQAREEASAELMTKELVRVRVNKGDLTRRARAYEQRRRELEARMKELLKDINECRSPFCELLDEVSLCLSHEVHIVDKLLDQLFKSCRLDDFEKFSKSFELFVQTNNDFVKEFSKLRRVLPIDLRSLSFVALRFFQSTSCRQLRLISNSSEFHSEVKTIRDRINQLSQPEDSNKPIKLMGIERHHPIKSSANRSPSCSMSRSVCIEVSSPEFQSIQKSFFLNLMNTFSEHFDLSSDGLTARLLQGIWLLEVNSKQTIDLQSLLEIKNSGTLRNHREVEWVLFRLDPEASVLKLSTEAKTPETRFPAESLQTLEMSTTTIGLLKAKMPQFYDPLKLSSGFEQELLDLSKCQAGDFRLRLDQSMRRFVASSLSDLFSMVLMSRLHWFESFEAFHL
jgi:uncharacterized coiled-coil DUF342 family protein